MGTHLKVTSGYTIAKPGEMAAILNNLAEGDILFVDEIHRLNRQVEEVLYPAMEDYVIDVMIGKGESARSIRLNLPKFTLVGATTRPECFRHRFATVLVSSATWNIIRWRNFARLFCSRHRYWMWKLMKKALTSLPAVPGNSPSGKPSAQAGA